VVLHRFSDLAFILIFHVFGYRKKVVYQNLKNSFPQKTHLQLVEIQKNFYRHFCDLIFETIKTFSISKEEILKRCQLENPGVLFKLYQDQKNIAGISSHMGNWEWLSLSLSALCDYELLAVYKPLANRKLNSLVINSRQRFGAIFVAIKNLKSSLDQPHLKPYFVGLLSDQAPHDYHKALEFQFLNQPTFFVPGPGIISVQRGLTPAYGWIKKIGRSRYTWKLEVFDEPIPEYADLNQVEQNQIQKISQAHQLSQKDSILVYVITKKFVYQLEKQIKMAPQDWLWSHRRWKLR
jgi:KDO2-lipid IV(A) lauroyltransferase